MHSLNEQKHVQQYCLHCQRSFPTPEFPFSATGEIIVEGSTLPVPGAISKDIYLSLNPQTGEVDAAADPTKQLLAIQAEPAKPEVLGKPSPVAAGCFFLDRVRKSRQCSLDGKLKAQYYCDNAVSVQNDGDEENGPFYFSMFRPKAMVASRRAMLVSWRLHLVMLKLAYLNKL
jgi:hypothetical protein